MAKLSLLEITQDILSDLNDDEVNSISDTVESLQVAQIVKSTYFELMDLQNWPHLRRLMSLTSSADNNRPTHMIVPDLVKEIDQIEYNRKQTTTGRDNYGVVKYLHPDEFLRITSAYNSTQDNVKRVVDYSGVNLLVYTDKQPDYWTSFDDDHIVFNAHNSAIESTLQSANSRMFGYVSATWQMTDAFIPDMPEEMFSMLLAEAKSVAFVRLKQAADAKAEQQARRQMARMKRDSWRTEGGIGLPCYARRSLK